MVLRVWNDTTLTYRCCPLCWTAMPEGPSYPTRCSKQKCPNKDGLSVHRYRAKVVVIDNTSKATLTLFDQAAEELFNTSSDNITQFQSEAGGHLKIASILQQAMNKHFLFYIRVTSTNFRYISNMYSSGYTAESAEWIPKTYKPQLLPDSSKLSTPHPSNQAQPLSDITGPSASRPSIKGKAIATHSSPPQHNIQQLSFYNSRLIVFILFCNVRLIVFILAIFFPPTIFL